MANIFFNGDKLSKENAINSLTLEISNYFSGRYEVKTGSDDGGSVLEVFVEVPEPSVPVLEQCPDFPLFEVVPKWGGWRCQVVKVPPGYIDAILMASEPSYDI
jgi:hypothetical protein|tara:strand:- start:1271 stop:1579 length:309 start_codon:yes stop_codon:yes gene_type:complete